MEYNKDEAREKTKRKYPEMFKISKFESRLKAMRKRGEEKREKNRKRFDLIIKMREEKISYRNIGKKFGISYERVRQIIIENK